MQLLEMVQRLNSPSTNEVVADTNNAKFLYVNNNIGHTFKQMNLSINGIVMSAQTNTYGYSTF